MSKDRSIDVTIFSAVSAPLRLKILRLIYIQGALGYSAIMNQLKLDPSRDAGKFAYHLRSLLQAGLIEADRNVKKYKLTVLGNMVIGFSQGLEEYTLKSEKRLFVRTSRLAMEDFDKNRIVQALNREAKVPIDLAKKIAEETEERLLKLDTLYLTAPLIREFVNAVLIEKGLQEYRHRLTRLGLPVYDVAKLIKRAETSSTDIEDINNLMGRNVMVEYVLLNVLSRKIADAHLSGLIHLSNVDMWVLRPDELFHDLRPFIRGGFRPKRGKSTTMALGPPKTFESALTITSSIIDSSRMEISGEQVFNHFNIFLSPFVRLISKEDISESLRHFLFHISQTNSKVSLGVDFRVPKELEEAQVSKNGEKRFGYYGDYLDEGQKILDVLLDLMFEDFDGKPVFNPHLVLNIDPSDLKGRESQKYLYKAHRLAAMYGSPIFTNLAPSWQKGAVYSSTGIRQSTDRTGDWELDTVRTGNLGSVIINLPRLSYEAGERIDTFFESLDGCLKMAVDSLNKKYTAVKERMKSLRLLSYEVAGEPYFRIENSSFTIGFVGLNETTILQTGQQLYNREETIDHAVRLVNHIVSMAKELSQKTGFRILVSQSCDDDAAQRLAELDTERYGRDEVVAQGTRTAPFYTDLVTVPLESEIPLRDRMKIESLFHPILNGGHLFLIEMEEPERDPEVLLNQTREICKSYDIGAFAFTRSYGYCMNCQQIFGGIRKKCPRCRSMKNFIQYSRLSSKYLPLDDWSQAKRSHIDKRMRYLLT